MFVRPHPIVLVIVCALLVAAVLFVFAQTTGFPFVNYDDPAYSNPVIARGLTASGFRYAFTYGEIGHWHPLTWISHMLDFQMFGASKPGYHHVTSVVLHALAAVLLFLFLVETTAAVYPSAFVAFVFAIHPLRAESVVWIAERKDVLSGVFFMLTLLAYVRYVKKPTVLRYVLVALLFAAGLMSKNMLVTLPLVLLLLDWWPLKRGLGVGLLWEKVPLLILSAISIVITLNVPERLAAVERVPLTTRLGNATVTPVRYLVQFFYPRGMAVYYPYKTLPLWQVAGSCALLLIVSAAAIRYREKAPYAAVGWSWYLVMLVPVAGVVQISNYAHADRYTYLPQIGIAIAIAWSCFSLAQSQAVRYAFAALAFVVVGVLAATARAQVATWRSSEALWSHALAVTGPNAVAYHGLGAATMSAGRLDEAVRSFRIAVACDPNYFPAQESLGQALVATGHTAEAVPHFRQAIALSPSYTLAHHDLGDALLSLNQPREALAEYQSALALRPAYFDALVGAGNAEMRLGDPAAALPYYRSALELDPHSATALANAGSAAAATGDAEQGLSYLREALTRNPANAAIHRELGDALLSRGRLQEALSEYRTAVALAPHDAATHVNLGLALAQSGDVDASINEYRSATNDDPASAEAFVLLGSALALKHQLREALPLLEHAVELDRGEHAAVFDRLAAVYAMSGRFADAARSASSGAAIAEKQGDAKTANGLREDAQNYSKRASHP